MGKNTIDLDYFRPSDQIEKSLKDFLENDPLYKKLQFKKAISAAEYIPKPSIHMYCETCKSDQTFQMVNKYFENEAYIRKFLVGGTVAGGITRAIYRCAGCNAFTREFLLLFSQGLTSVKKVGQHPPWEIKVENSLSNVLGDYVHLYKKGLACESQGYGIGALSYYRRILEEIIDQFLDLAIDVIPSSEKPKYQEALEKTKKTKIAQEKIKLVKDLLPAVLRPEGINPLAILHDSYSAGLHGRSEDDCLQMAADLRNSLKFLVNQISLSRKEAKQFTDSMKKYLDKKSQKKT